MDGRRPGVRARLSHVLFASGWRAGIAVVALAVAVAGLGEISAAQAWERQRIALHREAISSAERAAAALDGRIRPLRHVVAAVASDPAIRAAAVTRDGAAVDRVLADFSARVPDGEIGGRVAASTHAWYVVDASGVTVGQVVARPLGAVSGATTGVPSSLDAEGRVRRIAVRVDERDLSELKRLARIDGPATHVVTTAAGSFGNMDGVGIRPAVVVMGSIPGGLDAFAGAFVLETGASRTVGALSAHAPERGDVYVVGRDGALVGRARDQFDYRTRAPVPVAGDVPVDGHDEIASGRRIVAARMVPGVDLRVVASIDPAPAEAELAATLGQERAIRFVLLGLLVLAAVLLSGALSALRRQRSSLAKSLEQQSAVAEILRVIASSPDSVGPVFAAIVERARVICDADDAWAMERVGDRSRRLAYSGDSEHLRFLRDPAELRPIDPAVPGGQALTQGRVVHISDVDDPSELPVTLLRGLVRTVLAVPLLRAGEPIGVIMLSRQRARPFTASQIELVKTFADQAVVAIENVRLFNETREALEQQTATAEVLQTINREALDLPSVLETVVTAAGRLCDADVGWLNQAADDAGEVPGVRPDGAHFSGRWSRVGAYYARSEELRDRAYAAFTQVKPIGGLFPMYRETATSLAILDRKVVNVPDWTAEPELRASGFARAMNVRALLAVPLIREGEAIGAIALGRLDPRAFSEREISLAQTFADQAVIAIENVRLFNEIQDKSRALEAASRHKSEFLANMSHELRTPLNAVIGFSEVLESGMTGDLNAKQREYVRDIASSGKHLLDLVNEILDLSKVEAGRMDLEKSEFAAADAILSTFAFVRERAAHHGIELAADVPADLGTLIADERKVRQVLLNLLSNAVKFTPDGGWIGVSARRENGELIVSVRDTGIGIAPEDQAKVFEEFRQVGKASDRSREGTGLGLALAKRLVELHGGRIWLESQVGKGTTFAFALPVGSEVGATT